MTLADKITEERKKLGLSQEELAEKLLVSRQAVSKWESAQSTPDLQKIIAMSELFSVSTDYLLKEDAVSEVGTADRTAPGQAARFVSMEEAHAFLRTVKEQSGIVAFGVLLCILCPVLLIFLSGLAGANIGGITEAVALAVGLAVIFVLIAVAVFLFIGYGSKTERFDYLQKEAFETAFGVREMVKEKKNAFAPTYTRYLSLGVVLCVLSPLPLIIAASLNEADVIVVSMTALLLCIVAVGVWLIVRVAMIQSGYEILLQEGDYRKAEKKNRNACGVASGGYWCVVTAGYLVWSFLKNAWGDTWIVWPVAGVLFAPFMMIVRLICAGKERNSR